MRSDGEAQVWWGFARWWLGASFKLKSVRCSRLYAWHHTEHTTHIKFLKNTLQCLMLYHLLLSDALWRVGVVVKRVRSYFDSTLKWKIMFRERSIQAWPCILTLSCRVWCPSALEGFTYQFPGQYTSICISELPQDNTLERQAVEGHCIGSIILGPAATEFTSLSSRIQSVVINMFVASRNG